VSFPQPGRKLKFPPKQSNLTFGSASKPADVFVSYSHKDRFWKDWLLEGYPSDGPATFEFWSDDEIRPSEDWLSEIKSRLQRSKVAVLLVSRSFLSSQFIRDIELPKILQERENMRAKILWVPLERNMRKLAGTVLPGIQGVWPINSPLKTLQETQPAEVLTAARHAIRDCILREVDPEFWQVRRLFEGHHNYEVIRRLGEGPSRNVYLARDHALKRFVSVVIPKQSEDLNEFQEGLRDASGVEDLEVFLTVYEADVKANPPFYIRQYVGGEALSERLQNGILESRVVRDMLLRLARGVDLAHRRDFYHLNIKPSNVMVSPGDSVYLSALSRQRNYFEWLKAKWSEQGADHPTDEDYAYAVPEFFLGRVVPRESLAKSDQYLLGLLGYQMLTGKLPEREGISLKRVPASFGDFGPLKRIHEFESCRLCPEVLRDTVERMASPEPSDRFDNLRDALVRLEQFGEEHLTTAKESYRRVTAVKNWKSKVLKKEFYDKFIPLSRSRRAREIFKKMDWERQYEMLTEAVLLLFVFCEFDAPDPRDPTVLSRVANKHSRLNLEVGDLDLFQDLLIEAFVRNDPVCVSDDAVRESVRQAWRKSLQPGVEFMKRHVSQ
jgi:serine/threonine protein kinase